MEAQPVSGSLLSHLQCGNCDAIDRADLLQTVCVGCAGPLLARYEVERAPGLAEVLGRPRGQFRFHEMLPLGPDAPSLGEGATPMVSAPGLGANVWVKDEAENPTGSFKARGMAVAVPRNLALGADRFCLPSNGNAGNAAATYARLVGATVEVAVPSNTPKPLVDETVANGGVVTLVHGTIADAGRVLGEKVADEGLFSLATLHEPYRIEGKKMMGYEIFWDLGMVPDIVIYPTGGGTGLIGIAKAFEEMRELGWVGEKVPRMVAVQSNVCAPIVRAWEAGEEYAGVWEDPGETIAYGLRVPSLLGDHLVLKAIRETGGTAIAVSDDEMLNGCTDLFETTGIRGSAEGGACVAAYQKLLESGWLNGDDSVVLLNTGSSDVYRR